MWSAGIKYINSINVMDDNIKTLKLTVFERTRFDSNKNMNCNYY